MSDHSDEAALKQLARRVENGFESRTQSVAQWELDAWHRMLAFRAVREDAEPAGPAKPLWFGVLSKSGIPQMSFLFRTDADRHRGWFDKRYPDHAPSYVVPLYEHPSARVPEPANSAGLSADQLAQLAARTTADFTALDDSCLIDAVWRDGFGAAQGEPGVDHNVSCGALLERLTSLRALSRVPDGGSHVWADAASAPKTGEHILVTQLDRKGFGMCGGKSQDWCAVVHYWPHQGEEGFYLSSGASASIDDRGVEFSHWKPLVVETTDTPEEKR